MLVSTDKNKDTLKKYAELWDKFKDLIRSVTNATGDYAEKYINIKFNSDNNLPLNKILDFQILVARSVYHVFWHVDTPSWKIDTPLAFWHAKLKTWQALGKLACWHNDWHVGIEKWEVGTLLASWQVNQAGTHGMHGTQYSKLCVK